MTSREAIEFLKNMIDREAIGFVNPTGEGDVAIWQYHTEALQMAVKALTEQRWIPCAERLPDEDLWTGKRQCSDSVLMTVYCAEDEERITDYGHTVDGRWYSETIQKYVPDCWEVVAWCELPEPWKGDE